MTAFTRRTPLLTALAMLVAFAAPAMTLGAQNASAAPYKKCSLSDRDQDPPGSRPTYNLTLKRQKTSCSTARKVMRSFHKCRSKNSHKCTKRLLSRWRCTGRKESSIATVFYANFTCTWGTRRVRGTYQQNT